MKWQEDCTRLYRHQLSLRTRTQLSYLKTFQLDYKKGFHHKVIGFLNTYTIKKIKSIVLYYLCSMIKGEKTINVKTNWVVKGLYQLISYKRSTVYIVVELLETIWVWFKPFISWLNTRHYTTTHKFLIERVPFLLKNFRTKRHKWFNIIFMEVVPTKFRWSDSTTCVSPLFYLCHPRPFDYSWSRSSSIEIVRTVLDIK